MAEKKEEKRGLKEQNKLLYHSHQRLQRDDRAKHKSLFI
jgi:hypothetical protein